MSRSAPTPLNPREAETLVQHLSPGDRVRITTIELPRTICTVRETHTQTHCGPHLVLTALTITTSAQHETHQATYHCTSQPDSAMSVFEYFHTSSDTTVRCIGSLTTITRLPCLSTPGEDTAVPVEVSADE